MLGVLFLRMGIDSVAKIVKVGADDYEGIIVGFLVVLAVAFNELRQARGRGKQFFAGALGAAAIGILSLLAGTLSAIMIGRKAGMVGRMPVLSGHNQLEGALQLVSQRNDGVAVRNRQRAARQKVVLKTNEK